MHFNVFMNKYSSMIPPEDFKPVCYGRYLDDIFALRSTDHLEKFTNYLNSKHKNIKFTYEKESNNSLPFLDIWRQDQRTGILRYLFTTNQLLVEYIPTSIVSLTPNLKLVWFLLCYLRHFQLPLTFPGFSRKSVI